MRCLLPAILLRHTAADGMMLSSPDDRFSKVRFKQFPPAYVIATCVLEFNK